jgi:hypothetical protein
MWDGSSETHSGIRFKKPQKKWEYFIRN